MKSFRVLFYVVLISVLTIGLKPVTAFAASHQIHGSMSGKHEEISPIVITKTKRVKLEAEPADWMWKVPDNTLIKNLNIPATHDSGTSVVNRFLAFLARCQSLSIPEQLEKGIRYFDIRVRNDGLINHGGITCWKKTTDEKLASDNSQELWIENVIAYVEKFLQKHTTESVILQIKSEGGGTCTDAVNSQLENNDFYYSEGKDIDNLTLGDVRGKFLIFNRQEGILHGYDYANWTNNTEYEPNFKIENSSSCLQDNYKNNSKRKIEVIKRFYQKTWKTANTKPFKLWLNFSSCTDVPFPLSWIYPTVNDFMLNYVKEHPNKKLGVVLMDFPDDELIKTIYDTNL